MSKYDSNQEYWVPESDKTSEKGKTVATEQRGILASSNVGAAAGTFYHHVSKNSIVRVVPAVDTLVFWDNDKTTTKATDLATGFLLVAKEEYFMASGDFEFLIADIGSLSVVKIRQRA